MMNVVTYRTMRDGKWEDKEWVQLWLRSGRRGIGSRRIRNGAADTESEYECRFPGMGPECQGK